MNEGVYAPNTRFPECCGECAFMVDEPREEPYCGRAVGKGSWAFVDPHRKPEWCDLKRIAIPIEDVRLAYPAVDENGLPWLSNHAKRVEDTAGAERGWRQIVIAQIVEEYDVRKLEKALELVKEVVDYYYGSPNSRDLCERLDTICRKLTAVVTEARGKR